MFRRDRPCPVHDKPTPRKIAELEVATGLNPNAMTELEVRAAAGEIDLIEFFNDPRLTYCTNRRCIERRGY